MQDRDEQKFEMTVTVALGIAVLAIFAWIGTSDFQDEVQTESEYCEMVGIWQGEAKRGVAPAQRRGWPDFKGIYAEACK